MGAEFGCLRVFDFQFSSGLSPYKPTRLSRLKLLSFQVFFPNGCFPTCCWCGRSSNSCSFGRFVVSFSSSFPCQFLLIRSRAWGGSTCGQAVIAGLKALEEENRNIAVGGDPLFPAGSGERADTGAVSGRPSARHAGPAMEVRWRVNKMVGLH